MGEQVGGVNSFRKQFIETKNILIQEGVQNPTTKEIVAAMKKQKAEQAQQEPLTGLQLERNLNPQQFLQRSNEMAQLAKQKTGHKQFANNAIMSALSNHNNIAMQEISAVMTNSALTEAQKNEEVKKIYARMQEKQQQAQEFMTLFEQKLEYAYGELAAFKNSCTYEIANIQDDKTMTPEQKSNLIGQIQGKEFEKTQEIITNINNELDAIKKNLLNDTPLQKQSEPSVTKAPDPDPTANDVVDPNNPPGEPSPTPSAEA